MADDNPQRGDVWLINFDPTKGAEIKKERPAVVMNVANAGRLRLRIIVPITTGAAHFNHYFWIIPIARTAVNGLSHDSFADAFQVKSVANERFVKKLGILTVDQIQMIAAAVVLCIGYTPPKPKTP